MTRKMLINASDPRETRVAILRDGRLDAFQFSFNDRQVTIGNIYLGMVARVEPSLQAAFIDYGAERQGFLPFAEIHPDYYRVGDEPHPAKNGEDDEPSIQNVIKQGQLVMVQVNKEWPGSHKGASLSTRITLAGRYCVFFPNSVRGGGISRKIENADERARLQSIVDEANLNEGMSLIIRTSGEKRTKNEILDDLKALKQVWENIRNAAHEHKPPLFLYEDSKIIMQAIRDLYDDGMDEILVDNEECMEEVRHSLRLFAPGHERKVRLFDNKQGTLFSHYAIEDDLIALYEPTGHLPSGGSIVIQPTEALTVIDVNSGRATQQKGLEQTALKINLEAAEEIAKRITLCEIAGLIVIDFIDMESTANRIKVEKCLRDAFATDKARTQIGRITPFGLLEMSRQRLRASFFDLTAQSCPHCNGRGLMRNPAIASAHIVRRLESEARKVQGKKEKITLSVHPETALQLLNQERQNISRIEINYAVNVEIILFHDAKDRPLDSYSFGEVTPHKKEAPFSSARRQEQRNGHANRGRNHPRNKGRGRSPRRHNRKPGVGQYSRKASWRDKVIGLFK